VSDQHDDTADDTADAANVASFARLGNELASRVIEVLPSWVDRTVRRFLADAEQDAVDAAAASAVDAVEGPLRSLLAADLDEQRGTPLTIIRRAVQYPTAVLEAAGVPPVQRDPFAERSFPLDHYDLSPGSWSDLDESLGDPGLRWSVAKAFLHRQRHAG
jgi:hypothetical protein